MKKLTNSDRLELLGQLIDVFEDFLEEKGIQLDNPERDEAEDDFAAIIYGSDYDALSDGIESVLKNWKLICNERKPQKLKDVLQHVAYGVALDIWEVNKRQGRHLFPYSDLTTRETIEQHHPELLERELAGGIHAEGIRKDNIVIPVKSKEEMKKNVRN